VALGVAYVLSRDFEQLTDAVVVGEFPFYALAVIAVFVLRRREPDMPRPFKVPGYPIVPLLFLAGAGALVIGSIADADPMALYALGLAIAGIPLGLWFRSRKFKVQS
jgi:APA family basic amino acid/polyamine antiporter